LLFSIAEIERATGINRDTLRVWERRYGFPTPLRTPGSGRLYPDDQLQRLRLMKQLLDSGMRPGTLVQMDEMQLRRLIDNRSEAASLPAAVALLLTTLTGARRHELRNQLDELLQQLGLRDFLCDVVAPMNHAVGEAWFAGRLGILDEHFYTEQVKGIVTAALHSLPRHTVNARVLLTTLPGELHGIGLLMVACMLGLQGADILLLGVQTPLEEIVRGARESKCAYVGLSCSEYMNQRTIATQLVRLRTMLPQCISLWVGGSGVKNLRSVPGNIRLFTDLQQISLAMPHTREAIA
jgi:DNA-binding transcriptional MerR regulator/methylmalonyl-CoA mutase cobalamin-binding subunit